MSAAPHARRLHRQGAKRQRLGAEGVSGAAVAGRPASSSGVTKFTNSGSSRCCGPSKLYEVTAQLAKSPCASIDEASASRGVHEIAHAVHHHLASHDKYAPVVVLESDHLRQAALAQHQVAPALAAGWPEVKLADMRVLLGQSGSRRLMLWCVSRASMPNSFSRPFAPRR